MGEKDTQQKAQTIHLGGNNKMENKDQVQPQQSAITMTSNLKQLLEIPLGVEPTGAIYTVTTAMFKKYFREYFARKGYQGVDFANGKINGLHLPEMFLAFPKSANMIATGKQASERKEMLMGTRDRGAHIRMDGKFRELVAAFCSDAYRPNVQTKGGICFVQVDPNLVAARLFKVGNGYQVSLIDIASESKNHHLYKFARTYRAPNNNRVSIEDLLS